MRRHLGLLAALVIFPLAPCFAQEDIADAIPGLRPELTFRFNLPASLSDGTLTVGDAIARSPYFQHTTGAWRLIAGFSYRVTSLDINGGDVRSFTGNAITLPVDLFWLPKGNDPGWFGWFRLAPGLYSDLHSIGSHDVGGGLLAALGYRPDTHWAFLLGGYYSREVGAPRMLPAVGVVWMPCPHWTVALVPPNFFVKWTIDDKWALKFRVEPEGGSWHDSTAQGRVYDFRQYVSGLEAERKIAKHAALYVGAGYAFSGKLEVREDGGDGIYSSWIKPGPSFNAGLKISF